MRDPRPKTSPAALVTIVVWLAAAPLSAQYAVTEIARGAIPGAINAGSTVVGEVERGGRVHCFLWDGVVHDLGTAGPGDCHATGLTDGGLVVGTRTDPDSEAWQTFVCDLSTARCTDVP